MEQTLQDRIRERAYHFWSNGSGQGDDNDYWLMAEREVLAEIAAESLLASASPESAQPVTLSRSRQFDGCEIEIIDGLPDWSSRTSVETAGTGTGNPRRSPW